MNRRNFLGISLGLSTIPFLSRFVDKSNASVEAKPLDQSIGNRILTPELITREAMKILNNNMARMEAIKSSKLEVGDIVTIEGIDGYMIITGKS